MTTAAFLGTNFLLLLTALTPALTACCAIGSCKLCIDDSLTSKVAADVTYSKGLCTIRYRSKVAMRLHHVNISKLHIFALIELILRMRAALDQIL